MTQIIISGPVKGGVGCKDPLASNYNPDPTVSPCGGCCKYSVTKPIFGCTDPLAINYNPDAQTCINTLGNLNSCCKYTTKLKPTVITEIITIPKLGPIDTKTKCAGPYGVLYDINSNLIVSGVESAKCCSQTNVSVTPPEGYQYYWDGKTCMIIPECPINTTCVDCTNFNWWNNTYIVNHNGQSLSVTSPILWQQVVDLVTNSGQTISVNTLTGDLINENCCKGVFKNGICFCQEVIEETYEPRCIATLQDFLNLIDTTAGYDFFINNFSIIGPSLGLTTTQVNFILLNINSTADNNGNNIQDLTEARLILSNALNTTGGFHVNFGTITDTPILMTKGVCDQYKGYWDGVNCMCKPIVDQCEIDLSQVQVINSYDFFNNPIQIVSLKEGGTQLNEACCNRIIKDNPNLGWVWQSPYCLAAPKEDCLPAIFELNNELMEVPSCGNDLELTMWVYFDKPKSPCQPIPDPPTDDTITIDGQFCDITLTPNTGAIVSTVNQVNVSNINNILSSQPIEQSVFLTQEVLPGGPFGIKGGGIITKIGEGSVGTAVGVGTQQPKVCCYNINNPILARVTTTDPLLNQFLTQVKTYNSTSDYFERWIQIKATLPTSGLTLNFGLNLEIYQGLNCCCDYDFFVDDIQVNCIGQESALVYNDIQCPGFNLTRVIDNKKSWVYNPGIPSVGISDYDVIERADGSFGMLNGEGRVNRTFAPSLDANIPWRYTDYWKQSSVYENHSNLVLNTKELWLTFDMCADCPITGTTLVCPDGFTLSANTQVCYKIEEPEQKIFQNGDDFIFMNGENYIFQFQ